jgi:hypothetical protein
MAALKHKYKDHRENVRKGDSLETKIGEICVHGIGVDSRTGCAHYRSALDIVAIKFECCRTYYSCFIVTRQKLITVCASGVAPSSIRRRSYAAPVVLN